MAFSRIPAPVDNKVSSVLYFAKSTRHFTTQLGGDFCGTVSKRCVTVEQPSKSVGQRDRFFLSFAGRVAQSINQWHVSVMQKRGGGLNGFIHRGFATVDQCVRIVVVGRVIQEPRLAEDTGFLRFMNPSVVGMKLDVVAHTTTKGACRVINDVEAHKFISREYSF